MNEEASIAISRGIIQPTVNLSPPLETTVMRGREEEEEDRVFPPPFFQQTPIILLHKGERERRMQFFQHVFLGTPHPTLLCTTYQLVHNARRQVALMCVVWTDKDWRVCYLRNKKGRA